MRASSNSRAQALQQSSLCRRENVQSGFQLRSMTSLPRAPGVNTCDQQELENALERKTVVIHANA